MPRVQNENAHPDRDRARSKSTKLSASVTSTKRRPLGENARQSASAPPTQKPAQKAVRQRSVLAPLADNAPQTERTRVSDKAQETRANVAKLPRLKSTPSQLRPKSAVAGTERKSAASCAKPERRPASPHTPPRQLAPKTPAEQVGRAGAVRAALLNRRRPIVVPDPAPRPRVHRSISVRADEVSAAPSAIDRGYAPSPKRSAKADAMLRSVFPEGPEGNMLDEPPSPPCAFGGGDFKFDLV